MAFESLKHRIRMMDNRELRKELKLVKSLRDYAPANELYHEYIVEEIALRDREYTDWISKELV